MSSPSGSASTHASASTASSAAADLRRRRRPGGQREVLAQRADEDVVLLGDQRDVPAQVVERQLDQPTPPTVTSPVRGGWMPASSRPSVDLPAPDGPTMASRSPAPTSRSTPCSTSRPVDVGEADVVGVELLVRRARAGRPRGRRAPGRRRAAGPARPRPTCSSSSQESSRSTGSMSICTYSVAAVTSPERDLPWVYSQPPMSRVSTVGIR